MAARLVNAMHGALGFVEGPALTAPELTRWHITNNHQELTEGSIAEYCPAVEPICGKWLAGSRAVAGHV